MVTLGYILPLISLAFSLWVYFKSKRKSDIKDFIKPNEEFLFLKSPIYKDMKTLRHICEETDKEINYLGAPSGTLEKLTTEWIGDMEIVDYKISVKSGNLIIISRYVDTMTSANGANYNYSIHRFFPFGNKWHVSADLADKNMQETMSYLLKHFNA